MGWVGPGVFPGGQNVHHHQAAVAVAVAVAAVGELLAVVELRGGLPKIVAVVVAEQTAVEQIVVEGQTAAEGQIAVVVYPVVVGKIAGAAVGQTVGAAVGQTAVVAVVHLVVGEDHQKRQ